MAARQLIGRDDAVAFFDAIERFKIGGIETVDRSHAAENRVQHSGGAMDGEIQRNQSIDDALYLRFRGAFLHDNQHYF